MVTGMLPCWTGECAIVIVIIIITLSYFSQILKTFLFQQFLIPRHYVSTMLFFPSLATRQWTSREHLLSIGLTSSATAEIARVVGNYAVQGHSRSSILVPCGFPLVINTNLHLISDSFQVIAY